MEKIKRGLKRALAYTIASVLAAMYMNIGMPMLSGMTESVYAAQGLRSLPTIVNYWFDASGYGDAYVYQTEPEDWVDINSSDFITNPPNKDKKGYHSETVNSETYRVARWVSRTFTCGRVQGDGDYVCNATVTEYKSMWGFISDDGTVYSYGIHTCAHCGGCSHGYTGCNNDHEGKNWGSTTVEFTAWVPNTYTIQYNENGGSGTMSSQSCIYDKDFEIPDNSFTWEGHEFTGWNTKADGSGTSYSAGASVKNLTSVDGDTVTLYAQWKSDTCTQTLNFYKNGALQQSKTYDVQYNTKFDAAAHAGDVTFGNCHYSSISKSSWTVTGAASADVYYVWDTLKVAYHGNGNTSGSTSGSTTDYGSTVTVASNGFTKTGYSFTGWNTKEDGSGESYTAGKTFTAKPSKDGETLDLHAQWKINSYTVTLNKGTGIKSVSGGGTYKYGDDVTVDAEVSGGYAWAGWYRDDGSKSGDDKKITLTMPACDLSYTAKATPNSYTVTFDANGGTTSLTSVTVTYDSTDYWDISWAANTRDGYEFAGWNTKADGTGTRVWSAAGKAATSIGGTRYWSASGDTYIWKHAGNLTVYAEWKDITPPTITVSPEDTDDEWVHGVYATITAADNEKLYDRNAYEYCLSPNRDYPDGTWEEYTNGEGFYLGYASGDYYLWVKRVCDGNGWILSNWSETGGDYVHVTFPADKSGYYHRFGPYLFDNNAPDLSSVGSSYGWYPDGTKIGFDIEDRHSGIESITITDMTGDTTDITEDRSFFFDTTGTSLYCITAVDKLGNTAKKPFIVRIDKEGVAIPDNAVWKGLDDLTLFSHWLPITYAVAFDRNDDDGGSTRATGTMEPKSLIYDVPAKLPLNGFKRTGYEFAAWNTEENGTGTPYGDEEIVKNLTDIRNRTVTLYAQWKPIESTLYFDYNKPEASSAVIKNADEESRDMSFDRPIGTLPEPSIDGWIFEGWYDDMGFEVQSTDIWKCTVPGGAVTIHAKWTVAGYEVRLHSMQPDNALSMINKIILSDWVWDSAGYYSRIFRYDEVYAIPSPDNVYRLTGYSIKGWYRDKSCSNHIGSGTKLWNLTTVDGGVVNLYPLWRDTSSPVITVTPTRTTNPDVDNDAVRSIDITVKIYEAGSGLAANNMYEYGFSTSSTVLPAEWVRYSDTTGAAGFTVTLPDLGSTMDGYYYLWIKKVKDRAGNDSISPSSLSSEGLYHVYGVYVFDNTAPSGTVRYAENNAMLGLYDMTITDNPYAVMTISNAADSISGIKDFVLVIEDAEDEANRTSFAFAEDGGLWECRFNLYGCLDSPETVERVRMRVIATDRLGNASTLPVTQYDFGTLQTGQPIQARDIGYAAVADSTSSDAGKNEGAAADDEYTAAQYVYERDAFRVEAYIENISYKGSGTSFIGGQKGLLRIYTFGYVHAVSADFGSTKKNLDTAYDISPDLNFTIIQPRKKTYIYPHAFYIPLHCAYSTYTDTAAFGYKGGRMQYRNVVYDVNGTLTHNIKTILKYNAD